MGPLIYGIILDDILPLYIVKKKAVGGQGRRKIVSRSNLNLGWVGGRRKAAPDIFWGINWVKVEQKPGGRGRGREYNNLPFKMHCDSIITRSCWIGD